MAAMSDVTPELPADVVERMHARWERAFVEGAGLETDAGAAAEAFVAYALDLLTKVYGKRDVSRRLFVMAQLFAASADSEEAQRSAGATGKNRITDSCRFRQLRAS